MTTASVAINVKEKMDAVLVCVSDVMERIVNATRLSASALIKQHVAQVKAQVNVAVVSVHVNSYYLN